jgi:hypothetical protein
LYTHTHTHTHTHARTHTSPDHISHSHDHLEYCDLILRVFPIKFSSVFAHLFQINLDDAIYITSVRFTFRNRLPSILISHGFVLQVICIHEILHKMLCAFPHYEILNIYNIMNICMHILFVQNFSVLKNTNLVTVLSRK